MNASLPRLRRITGEFEIAGDVKIRPADLYVSSGHRQPGIVLVGDAFETSCPVTGTGTDKVFTDVERLCNVHIPDWLATDGMDETQDRGVLRRSGQDRLRRLVEPRRPISFRSVSIDNGLYLAGAALGALSLRWFGEGILRRLRDAGSAPDPRSRAQSSSSSSLSSSA